MYSLISCTSQYRKLLPESCSICYGKTPLSPKKDNNNASCLYIGHFLIKPAAFVFAGITGAIA